MFDVLKMKIRSECSSCSFGDPVTKPRPGTLLESYLMLLCAVVRQSENEKFVALHFKKSKSQSKDAARLVLCEWTRILTVLLAEYSSKNDTQVHGYLITLLTEFAKMTSLLLKKVSILSSLWAETLGIVLKKDTYFQYILSCKRGSNSGKFLDFLTVIFSGNLLEFREMLASFDLLSILPWIVDPRLVEIPESIDFVASLLNSRGQEKIMSSLYSKLSNESSESLVSLDILQTAPYRLRSYFFYILVINSMATEGIVSKSSGMTCLETCGAASNLFDCLFFESHHERKTLFERASALSDDDADRGEGSFWFHDSFVDRSVDFCLPSAVPKASAGSSNVLTQSDLPKAARVLQDNPDMRAVLTSLYKLFDCIEESFAEDSRRAEEVSSSSNYLSSLQIAAMSLSVAFSSCIDFVLKCTLASDEKMTEIDPLLNRSISKFWEINILILKNFRIQLVKCSQYQEYFEVLLICLKSIFSIFSRKDTQFRSFSFEELRKTLSVEILFLTGRIKEDALNAGTRQQLGFGDEHSLKLPSRASSLQIPDDNFMDDDFMDDDMKDNEKEEDLEDSSKIRLQFTPEHKKVLSLAGRCLMMCASDLHHYEPLLLEGLFNLWTPIDFRLQFCVDLSSVSSALELYPFLHAKPWYICSLTFKFTSKTYYAVNVVVF